MSVVFDPKARDAQIEDLFGVIQVPHDSSDAVEMADEGAIPVAVLVDRVRDVLRKLPEQDVYDLKMLVLYCETH